MFGEQTVRPIKNGRKANANLVSRFGLAVRRLAGKQRDLGSILLRLSFLFKKVVVCGQTCDFVPHNYETLKWLPSLPTLMQKSFWWCQCSDRCIIPPPLPPPLPFSPSLISLMDSVGVKYHVYLLISVFGNGTT